MPRQARLDIQGCLYHVMARGIERRRLFIDETDYYDFLERLQAALKKSGCKCLAWCLMPNHFHLLILRGTRPLSELMRRLMTGYAINFNVRHRRAGHVFQNRYKAILCETDEYLLELVAYIHLNPLRAKMVRDFNGLNQLKWCGHGTITGAKADKILDRNYILNQFDSKKKAAIKKYLDFLADRSGKYKGKELSGGGLIKSLGGMEQAIEMMHCGAREMFDSRILGTGDFVEAVLKEVEPLDKIEKNMTREEALLETERITGIKAEKVMSSSRARKTSAGRAVYCYLMKEKGKFSGALLMKELGISSGGVSMLVQRGRDIVNSSNN